MKNSICFFFLYLFIQNFDLFFFVIGMWIKYVIVKPYKIIELIVCFVLSEINWYALLILWWPALFQKQTNIKHKRRMCAHPPSNTQEQHNIYLPLPTPSLMHTSRSNTPSPTQSEINNQKCERRENKRKRRKKICKRNVNGKKRT
jgi:hypothetical protein